MPQSNALAVAPQPPEQDPQEAALQLVADKINTVLDNGDFVPQREAQRILTEMQRDHPTELLAFLDAHAYRLVYDKIRDALASRKRYTKSRPKRMGDAARAGEDLAVFVAWRFRVADDDTQRAAGEMTGADWRFSAMESGNEEQRAARLKAFKLAVAKKVGKRKTSEVLSEEELLALHERLVG